MATLVERIIENEHETPERNPGTALDLARVASVEVNRSAVERRAATLPARRTVKKEWQAAWLLRAITCIDLTTLAGDDTPGAAQRLCAKARQPVKFELLEQLGALSLPIRTGAVCVYHALVPVAVEALAGSGIPVAAVSTGFPAGQNPLPQKLELIRSTEDEKKSQLKRLREFQTKNDKQSAAMLQRLAHAGETGAEELVGDGLLLLGERRHQGLPMGAARLQALGLGSLRNLWDRRERRPLAAFPRWAGRRGRTFTARPAR
jgi:hypothetical protein